MSGWKTFPAPDLERVIVAGYQPRRGNVAGYWWYHEDCTDGEGMPIDTPHATHWCPIVLPPFPEAPAIRGSIAVLEG